MTTNVKLMVVLQKLNYTFMNRLGKNLLELGMPASEYPIMAHLNEVGRAKTQDLGKVAIISSGTITHTVNKLVKQGYVKKVQDPTDKRIYWVEITKEGKVNFDKINTTHLAFLDSMLEGFSAEEKQAFIEQIKYFGLTIQNK